MAVCSVAVVSSIEGLCQPPPQALHFSHGRGERETRVTGDEPQGTMGRVETTGEARCLLPVFLCTHIFIERETSGYEAGVEPNKTPRQNVYACARLSIFSHFFSHTTQSKVSPARSASFCGQLVAQLFCFMLLVWITKHRSLKQLVD